MWASFTAKEMIKYGGTPDTIPSLGTLSHGSTDTEDVTRVLFGRPGQETPPNQYALGWPSEGRDSEKLKSPASDTTMALISEHYGDLDIDMNSDFYDELLAEEEIPEPTVQVAHGTPDENKTGQKQGQQSEVPIEASCHGGLNLSPQQLAKIFSLFDGSQRHWPPHRPPQSSSVPTESSTVQSPASEITEMGMDSDDDDDDDDAKTEVTSNTAPSNLQRMPQLQSLQRECEALKQIIRADSSKMFELKSELETLRGHVSQHLAQIRLLKSELDAVKRQRDVQRERECQHKESIKFLKSEIDQLTQAGGNVVSRREMEQMRIEHELLAAQIIENEYELIQMQSFVEATEAENARLRSLVLVEPIELQNKKDAPTKKEGSHGDLTEIVLALEARLVAVEQERARAKEDVEEGLRQRTKEMESLKAELIEDPTPEEQPRETEMSMSYEDHACTEIQTEQNYAPEGAEPGTESHGEEVECTLNGPIVSGQPKPPTDSSEHAKNAGGYCDAWSGLCDCFSPAASEEP